MEIWLKHPTHGVKCAYVESEAVADEKNGWARFDPSAKADQIVEKQDGGQVEVDTPIIFDAKEAEQVLVPVAEAQKKRGRSAKNQG